MDKGFFLSIEVLKITLFSVGEVFLINVIVMRCSFSKFQETAAKETTPVAESLVASTLAYLRSPYLWRYHETRWRNHEHKSFYKMS